MAKILHLETSTKNCSVSLAESGKLISLCEESSDGYQHAEKLHTFIQWAMEGTNWNFQDLDAVCVSKGPGSYTGLRIGVSAAKGLCFALEKPLLAIDSLTILANSVDEKCDLIVPMLDARRMEVYTTVFDSNKYQIQKIEAKILDENSFNEFAEKNIIFLGDGAEKAKEILQLKNAKYFPEINPSAEFMTELAFKKFQKNEFEDVAYFEPFYLKEFVSK